MERNCVDCKHYELGTDEEPCVYCYDHSEFEPPCISNADKIRSLSDEELATIFCTHNWTLAQYSECLEWLKGEVNQIYSK